MPHADVARAPHSHSVDFYERDHELVDLLARFVANGLHLGERVVVVSTEAHRSGLEVVLEALHVDPAAARSAGHLLTLDASATLDTFMGAAGPDPGRFSAAVETMLDEAGADGTTLRVFGEMVALLWDAGDVAGALELEALWNELLDRNHFTLLCAYPSSSLSSARLGDVIEVCARHTSVHPPSSYATGSVGAVRDEYFQVFLPVPEAVAAVRRFVTGVLSAWNEHGLVPDATLVASELSSNAVLHASSPFRVSVDRSVGMVCIAIQDAAVDRAEQQLSNGHDASGRGVAIVEALSRRWGCDSLPEGKVVWAELVSTRTDH